MVRKPAFWISFTLLSLAGTVFALKYFHLAYPLVSLDLKMDRVQALEAAQALAKRHEWGPEGYRQAASFELDGQAQSFVELEAGGSDAFAQMLKGDLYSPFTWRVRHFKQQETREILIRFTPAGAPYGFHEKVPEDQSGAALDTGAARVIAEHSARSHWGIDFAQYEGIEASQEVRPSGRVDHTFVYERPSPRVGDGQYRLRIVVSGDRCTELTHFIKIPEAFSRRYEKMRSANNSIAVGAGVAMFLLYVGGGCVIGLFFLLKQRWVLWRQPLLWGFAVSFIQVLVGLNRWPLTWMNYDTAVSGTNFVLQELAMLLVQFVGMGALMAVSFMAAESLTRRAFPRHLQLWKVWTKEVSSSWAVLGQTVSGYLLIGIFFAYEVILYFIANRHLGWWSPSGALTDPNVLATYYPWLTAIGVSLQAGFWEECLFRAVPLGCAALLGQRFGGRRYWILGALVLQAAVFGAGHANYPAQPAYARLVELILPAMMFGLVYLAYGLLPAIVLHFAYDVVWFALPLFASTSPGNWVNRLMVILLTLVPLWFVVRGRLQTGRFATVPPEYRNEAWAPPPRPQAEAAAAPPAEQAAGLGPRLRFALLGLGAAGLVLWGWTGNFKSDAPGLAIARTEAEVAAKQELAQRGVELSGPWRTLSVVSAAVDLDDRFVWQEGDPAVYQELLSSYLDPPQWRVRYARFEGDVVERAEEYRVLVDTHGKIAGFRHRLPEQRPGAVLEEAEARRVAHSVLTGVYGLDPATLEEVSSEPKKRPARRDWEFIYSNPEDYPLAKGDARISVILAGDEVVDTYRFVHIPEAWERLERDRSTRSLVLRIVCLVPLVLVFVGGAVFGIIRWSRGRFATRVFVTFLLVMAFITAINFANSWPQAVSQFSTAQSFGLQLGVLLGGFAMVLLGMSAVTALNIGLVHRLLPSQERSFSILAAVCAAGLGVFLSGLGAALSGLGAARAPAWAGFEAASAFFPLVAAASGPLSRLILGTAFVLLAYAVVHRATRGWTRRKVPFSLLLVLLGVLLGGSRGAETPALAALSGLAAGLALWAAYVVVLRFHLALVPVVIAAMSILATVREGYLQAFPGSLAGSLVGAFLAGALGLYWFYRLTQERSPQR